MPSNIYMQYDGGSIKGSATAEGYKDWITLSSLEFGVGRDVSMETGDSMNRARNMPLFEKIKVTKETDKSSKSLLSEAVMGGGKVVKINIVEPREQGKAQPYVEYELKNCVISNYTQSSDGDQPTEDIELSYTAIEVNFTTFDEAGNQADKGGITYDIAKAKV